MNYGKEFIKIYNNEFLKQKKDFKDYLKENFDSDYSYTTLSDNYLRKLSTLKKTQYNKDNFITNCREDFWFRYLKYHNNAAINIVNSEIQDRFNENLTRTSSKIKDFKIFINALAKYSLLMDFEDVFREKQDEIREAFKKHDLSSVFKIKKKSNAEYLLSYFEKKEEKSITDQKKESKSETLTTPKLLENPFTNNEKFILMNILLNNIGNEEIKITTYEIPLILKLSSGAYHKEPLHTKKDTLHEKTNKGIQYYAKSSQKKILKKLILKMDKFDCPNFKEHLEFTLLKI